MNLLCSLVENFTVVDNPCLTIGTDNSLIENRSLLDYSLIVNHAVIDNSCPIDNF